MPEPETTIKSKRGIFLVCVLLILAVPLLSQEQERLVIDRKKMSLEFDGKPEEIGWEHLIPFPMITLFT